MALNNGLNATFADPIKISTICAFFGKSMTTLKNTFAFANINAAGFNDLDAQNVAPFSMSEWRRYDHNRPSVNIDPIYFDAANQTNINYFTSSAVYHTVIHNNSYGRSYAYTLKWYINPTSYDTQNSNTFCFATNSGTIAAGGSFTDSATLTRSTVLFPHSSTVMTPDTNYYIWCEMSVITDSGSNTVKDYTNQANIRKYVLYGHVATAANIYQSYQGGLIWRASNVLGGIGISVRIYNNGESTGNGTSYCRMTYNSTTVSATAIYSVSGKVRGGSDNYTDYGFSPTFPFSKWAVGNIIPVELSLNGSTYTTVANITVLATAPT